MVDKKTWNMNQKIAKPPGLELQNSFSMLQELENDDAETDEFPMMTTAAYVTEKSMKDKIAKGRFVKVSQEEKRRTNKREYAEKAKMNNKAEASASHLERNQWGK